ncbi:MAG: DEAD/DEAH box helicase [Myxococcales bacterium]|nr:DEAD/DEAH box helicase [Myxococcales bacterium]
MRFLDLDLIEPLLRAVTEQGYDIPTPIQEQAIPPLLAGRDLLGCAQTGTGKTAAFALPILDRLERSLQPKAAVKLRVLVLAPTRELAVQIHESFEAYGKHTRTYCSVIFGGVSQVPQVRELRLGIDVLVATPGRLLDLMEQGHVKLGDVDTLVLDEADRMLDMGFVRDVQRIVAKLTTARQTMLFSATLAPEVVSLAKSLLRDPVNVSVTPQATTVERVAQSVCFVEKANKRGLLEHMLRDPAIERAIVFTRTKHGADRVVRNLAAAGLPAVALHGNKSQGQRTQALTAFKAGKTRVLVATDIAARGLDVDGVTHVINHDLPEVADAYVHRIGRTARAGADGAAVSFCDADERPLLRDIEKLIRQAIPVVTDHPFVAAPRAERAMPTPAPRREPARGFDARRPRDGGGGHAHRAAPRAPQATSGGHSAPTRRAPEGNQSMSAGPVVRDWW